MKKFFSLLLIILFSATVSSQEQFTLYFDFDIDEADMKSGKRLSNWIAQNDGAEILKIYGYADSIGNADYNMDLSLRRAKYVQQLLSSGNNNIFSEGLEVKGFGETKAFSANRSSDRIVIIHYKTPDDKKEAAAAPQPIQEEPKPAIVIEEFKQVSDIVASTPEPIEVGLTEEVNKAKTGDKIKLLGLNFYNNSDMPLPGSHPIMKELLDIMNENSKLKIDIQGHICCQVVEKNDISLKRAKAIYRFLQLNGIKTSRLSYQSFGSSRPIYPLPEKNEAERVANRRVEIEILEQ